ncbi:MAG: Rho-type gtpase-activating protein [Phylliscum demangeonii]|nr:MAG: Rho-type gtpase-activating protein [Phylliscum demangeonii]
MASSSALPAYHASGDFNLEEDMERILGGTDEASTSLLRRVSNAVRHGRSASENHSRTPSLAAKWPRSPITSSMIGSPTTTTAAAEPTTGGREDTTRLTHELRRSAQKIVELEARVRGGSREVVSLEQQVQERRSTVAFLDTQKELVVRELEILTEHVAELKRSPAPFNMGVLVSDVLHEFAASLERLKQSFGPQIEALTRQKNALGDETAQLTRLRDHALQETEQLNLKNAQLAVLNNELTHQIQERYRAHREGRGFADSARAPLLPGFGLVGAGGMPARERGETAFDGREARLGAAGNGVAAVAASAGPARASHGEHGDGEPATVLTAPHVINIRKGQVKKFNWKKGGQSVAKGLKGAFSSSSQSSGYPPPQGGREAAAALEGVPYGMTPVMEAPTTSLPRSLGDTPARHGLALFGQRLAKSGPMKMQSNGNLSVATSEAPSALFGSELIERTDVERRQIPCVVTRCVEEVELRGMDVEGIYRKTGGSGQVKLIQEGFEQSNDYDISDPHLDITAVTSVLKQYLRKLPTPLITFDAYDGFLEAHQHTGDDEQRVTMMRAIINHQLPAAHRDCLEFLVFHLARVATREKENLMSPRNLSVVFAPTLMRDHSLDREMTDMHAKNQAIQFLIEHNKSIFARE